MSPRLSILIPTVGERDGLFRKLVAELSPQVRGHKGEIEVLIFWNNCEHPISEIRQALVDEARGEYVCQLDDDDSVPDYYCDRIIGALASSPDYVGWAMQLWWNGEKMKPTYHSLRYDRWWDDADGYYRNVSHLNPIRRSIALQVPFTGHDGPEDYSWAQQVAPLVKTEEYIEDPMYFYCFNPADSIWRGRPPPTRNYTRPRLPKYFRYHPDSKTRFVAQ